MAKHPLGIYPGSVSIPHARERLEQEGWPYSKQFAWNGELPLELIAETAEYALEHAEQRTES